MNQIHASKLHSLSPVPSRPSSRPSLPGDRFEADSGDGGPRWGLIGLGALGVLASGAGLALPHCKFIIEIKHPHGGRHVGIEQILIDQLQRSHTEERAVVISFDETSLKTLHQLEPELTTGYLYAGKELDPQQTREQLGVTYLGPQFGAVNQNYVDKAHEAGMKVNPWTVNEDKDLRHRLELVREAASAHQGVR